MMISRVLLLALGGALTLRCMAELVPVLPETPLNYANIALPDHYLINAIPGNSPFQNAVIDNDNTPANNPTTDDGATLGRVLFYDRQLSGNGTVSCASCHDQSHGFSDARRLSPGFNGGSTRRHSMGLTNARFYEPGKFFWDERAATLEDQVLIPFQDPVEMGLTLEQLVGIVSAQSYYPELFRNAFGDETVSSDRISRALAQFVRSIVSTNSKYDQGRVTVNDPFVPFSNFTPQENQGKALFMNVGNRPVGCIDCHVTEAFISPFSASPHASGTSATTNNGLDPVSTDDLGVAETTRNVADTGHFKVPSLRNIGVTAPYMHDGRFDSLDEVLRFYDRDIRNHPQLSDILVAPNGNAVQIRFNNNERDAISAFLHTLTDQALLTDPKYSDPFVEVVAVDDTPTEPEVTLPEPTPFTGLARLANLSTRARIGAGENTLVAGFVVVGDAPKTLLIRGIGPHLANLDVPGGITTPVLRLYHDGEIIASNTAWSTSADADVIASTAAALGAFALPAGSADSALLVTSPPGLYTAHLLSADGATGLGLIEVYDATADVGAEMVNISSRVRLNAGGEIVIPGFVVSGEGPRTFLIRAIGPGLAELDVATPTSNPRLTVFREGNVVTTNDDWSLAGNAAEIEAATAAVGAFTLTAGSRDAATAVTLQPGSYTVHVDDADGSAGLLLVEIYAVPNG